MSRRRSLPMPEDAGQARWYAPLLLAVALAVALIAFAISPWLNTRN